MQHEANVAASNSRILSSHDLPPDDLGTCATGGYTPIAMSTTVMTPARNLANFGAETAGSGRFEPVELTTFSETLAGRPARCSAAANTGFEFVWRLRDCYDSMGPLCSSSLSGTYNRYLLTSRHLFEKSCVLTNPT